MNLETREIIVTFIGLIMKRETDSDKALFIVINKAYKLKALTQEQFNTSVKLLIGDKMNAKAYSGKEIISKVNKCFNEKAINLTDYIVLIHLGESYKIITEEEKETLLKDYEGKYPIGQDELKLIVKDLKRI